MKSVLEEGCHLKDNQYSMEVLLSCAYKDMSTLLWLIPFYRNKVIKQYLISIE